MLLPSSPGDTMAPATRRALAVAFGLSLAAPPALSQTAGTDSSAAMAVVERFHAALTSGDSARAVTLLANDVMVVEGGAVQTRAEYLGHHLGADMKASQGSKAVRAVIQVRIIGNAAYVVSKTVMPPTGAEGSTGSELAELMVLSKAASGWSIRAVHWSSRRRRA